MSLLIFGYIKFFNGTFIYISTGFGKDGLLKTGNKKASVMEADILLADAKVNMKIYLEQISGIRVSVM